VVKIEVICDRCRAAISTDRSKLIVETGPLRSLPANDNGEVAIDLCRACAGAFRAWLLSSAPVRNC
jgi:hypothetical protein